RLRPPRGVRRGRRRDGAGGQERPAQVGPPAAGAADNPLRRAGERLQARTENAALLQNRDSLLRPVDVELVPSCAVESPPPVCPNLGIDAESPQQPERSP